MRAWGKGENDQQGMWCRDPIEYKVKIESKCEDKVNGVVDGNRNQFRSSCWVDAGG